MSEVLKTYKISGEYQNGPFIGSHKGDVSLLSDNRLIGFINDMDFDYVKRPVVGIYNPKENSLGIAKFPVATYSTVCWWLESKIDSPELKGIYTGYYQFKNPSTEEEIFRNSNLNEKEIFEYIKKIFSKEKLSEEFFNKSIVQEIKRLGKMSRSNGNLEFRLK